MPLSGWGYTLDHCPNLQDHFTAREYVANSERFSNRHTRVINLTGDYDYLDMGYYCSLLAEARQHRIIPSVTTITALARRSLYAVELPELNSFLRSDIEKMPESPVASFTLLICFGKAIGGQFTTLSRQVFDRFRCPLLKIEIVRKERWGIKSLEPVAPSSLSPETFSIFLNTLEDYARVDWTAPKRRRQPRYSLAILHNPKESLAPSCPEALKKFAAIGAKMGIGVELIQRTDFLRLAEYDALFIRETTSVTDHTYRFARKAEREGMPVIDDPTSILRCTNKVYLAELLRSNKIATPKTLVLDRAELTALENTFEYPVVLKIPDGSFSRGISLAEDRDALRPIARDLFKRSAAILVQEFMPTEYDWRVGVLNNQPIFVSQYMMARNHWQIVKHEANGKLRQGKWKTFALEDAPADVIDAGVKAARLIGNGLYGVDLKKTEKGVFVIEVNDNPNIDRGVEDEVLKDDLYVVVLQDFIRRIEAR
ncbi:MAG: RimK family protein [Proteobacteria bacterium]|nr:RimK family protein [Pseudomonadota bacterium]